MNSNSGFAVKLIYNKHHRLLDTNPTMSNTKVKLRLKTLKNKKLSVIEDRIKQFSHYLFKVARSISKGTIDYKINVN